MISYKTIHQTDKTKDTLNWETEEWVKLNAKDGWRLNFLDDHDAEEWMLKHFGGSDVEWAWEYMHRGVLKADFLRYMLPLVEGGVYSDVDVGTSHTSSYSTDIWVDKTDPTD
jgi:alpha 1,6-mannosyltransferase